jgi:hypothetical protein
LHVQQFQIQALMVDVLYLVIIIKDVIWKLHMLMQHVNINSKSNELINIVFLKLLIVAVRVNHGYVICLSMVVWHTMVNIGACVQLIYVIPVILHLFVVWINQNKFWYCSKFCLKLGYDDCSNEPCPSGTLCLDTKDGFSCICPPWQDECTYCKRLF